MTYLYEPDYALVDNLVDFSTAFFDDSLDGYPLPKPYDLDMDNITGDTTDNSKIKNENLQFTKKKVGRKPMKDNQETPKEENCHSKYFKDNIIRKVQVHFQNYLVLLINEIIKNYGFDKKFLKIDYNNIKKVNKKNVENMKTKEIGQILRQNISTKYRKLYTIDKEMNNKLYLEVIKHDNIKKFLSETYINIFRNFYFINKREINEYDLNIKLSENVKAYQDLLEENEEDKEYIEKIKKVVEEYYLPKKRFVHN